MKKLFLIIILSVIPFIFSQSTCTQTVYRNCADVFKAGNFTDGVYTIDPDGISGPTAPFPVYCNMTLEGGGWTLIAKICANDKSDRWTYNAEIYRDTTVLGDATNLNIADAKSLAYSLVLGTQILIKDMNKEFYAAHTYTTTPISFGSYLNSIWDQCGYEISSAAVGLQDDNRDSLIGNKLYWRHFDGLIGNCSSQERAMLSEIQKNAGYVEVGTGVTEGNATYKDAQSAPKGATQYNYNVSEQHEDYAIYIR